MTLLLSRVFLLSAWLGLALCGGVATAFVPAVPRSALLRPSHSPCTPAAVTATLSSSLRATPKDDDTDVAAENEKDESGEQNILQQIKAAGTAGSISLFLWEAAFWAISIPVALFGYYQATGHWPDISDQEDVGKLGAAAFAFANAARFALPVRLGLALGTTPWVQTNIVDTFFHNNNNKNNDDKDDAEENGAASS